MQNQKIRSLQKELTELELTIVSLKQSGVAENNYPVQVLSKIDQLKTGIEQEIDKMEEEIFPCLLALERAAQAIKSCDSDASAWEMIKSQLLEEIDISESSLRGEY